MLPLHRCASWLWNAIIRLLTWVRPRWQRRRLWQAVKPVIRSHQESQTRQCQPVMASGDWCQARLFQRQLLGGLGTDSTSRESGEYGARLDLYVASSDDIDAGYWTSVDWGDDLPQAEQTA